MPLYDAAGRPLGPTPIIGAKKLADFAPMDDTTLDVAAKQLEAALAAGVPLDVPVTVATAVLIALVRRAQLYALTAETVAPLPEMPWMEPLPEGRELRLPQDLSEGDGSAEQPVEAA